MDADDKLLCYLAKIGLDKMGLSSNQEYLDRLKFELARITSKKYTPYFLMVWDYVRWCKLNNIMVGPGRGSIGGSLVAYALNITTVDPIKFSLLFDRFLSPIRKDMPDADIDFEDQKRDKLLDYLKQKYGEHNFAKIVTFSRFHGKGALRDIGRIFEIPIGEIEKTCRLVIQRSGGDARTDFCLEDTFTEFEQGKKFRNKYPNPCEIAIKLEGHIRHTGIHAAGAVISKRPIYEYAPTSKYSGEIVTAWEKKEVENMGLIKFDILGLKTLSIISETLDKVEQKTGTRPEIPTEFEDPKVYEKVFASGKTLGTFQFETTGMGKLIKQLRCDKFSTLYDASALYRPGPLHSGQTARYCRRHLGQEEWEYDHPLLESLTKETYGQILYQEQVMKVMHELGNFSWATAESARKIMTKSQGRDAFNKMRDEFKRNAHKKHKVPEEEAENIFNVVSTFGSYGFNKSHSVEYSIISYITGWLKTYYPEEFFATILGKVDGHKTVDYVRDAQHMGLKILPPDINRSKVGYSIHGDEIVAGFDAVKGIGKKSVDKLIRNQPYKSLEAFVKTKPTKTIWENLVLAGALDKLCSNRRWLHESRETIMKDGGQLPLNMPEEWSEKEHILNQMSVLDLPSEKPAINYFDNPLDGMVEFEPILDMQFLDYLDGRWVKGVVTFINFKSEGLEGSWAMFDNVLERRYAHLNINDGTGNILVHLSPEQYTYYKKYLEESKGFPIAVYGHSIKDYQKVFADAMFVLTDFDKENPMYKYVQDGRVKDLKEMKEKYKDRPQVTVNIVDSVTYKVSKNKKAYARIRFFNKPDLDQQRLVFQLDSDIFISGEILAYTMRSKPFIDIVERKK